MRSNPTHRLFYFPTRKYFKILLKFLDFLRSLDRFKVLIRVIISDFYYKTFKWLGEKNYIFTYPWIWGRRLKKGLDIAYVQTG